MDCPIWFCPIDAESQVVSTPCGHVFDSNCMETWIAQGKKNCPQCRKVCERQNIRPIFLPFSDQENPNAIIQRLKARIQRLLAGITQAQALIQEI